MSTPHVTRPARRRRPAWYRRIWYRAIWLWLVLVLGAILVGATSAYIQQGGFTGGSEEGGPEEGGADEEFPGDEQAGTLVRVVDGDTVVVEFDGGEERVRLLNIDAPESVHPSEPVECLGPEASEHLESLVSPGDEVVLEFDQERTDHYDRLLAGVYVDEDLLNEQMARAGFGYPVLYEPNDRFLDQIEDAWSEAEAAGAGVFADDLACQPEPP